MHFSHELMLQVMQDTSTAVKNTRYPFARPANNSNTIRLHDRFENKMSLSVHSKHLPIFLISFLFNFSLQRDFRLPRTITSRIKQTSCGIKRTLPDQPVYKCYAMFLDKWALHFNDEEFSQQLSQFSRTDALLKLATFRLKYKDNYEYKFSVLNTHFRFGWRNISKCTCSELKTYSCSSLRTSV